MATLWACSKVTDRAGGPLVSEGVPVPGEPQFRPGAPAGLLLSRSDVVPGVEQAHDADQVKVGGLHTKAKGGTPTIWLPHPGPRTMPRRPRP